MKNANFPKEFYKDLCSKSTWKWPELCCSLERATPTVSVESAYLVFTCNGVDDSNGCTNQVGWRLGTLTAHTNVLFA